MGLTVNTLIEKCGFKPLSLPDPGREVKGGYCGDLLSWVMSNAREGNAWITIMSNMNVIAVASLCDVSCVILAEGVLPDKELTQTAEQKGINLISDKRSAFEIASAISKEIFS